MGFLAGGGRRAGLVGLEVRIRRGKAGWGRAWFRRAWGGEVGTWFGEAWRGWARLGEDAAW